MKRSHIEIGGTYLATVNKKKATVKVLQVPGYSGSHYRVKNLVNGRTYVIRSYKDFIEEIDPDSPKPEVRKQLRKEAMTHAVDLAMTEAVAKTTDVGDKLFSKILDPDVSLPDGSPDPYETPFAKTLKDSIGKLNVRFEHKDGKEIDVQYAPEGGYDIELMRSEPQPEEEGLKGDQLKAFHIVTSRISTGEKVTKLVGYAGSGKTWLIARIASWALRNGHRPVVAAPTHKAVGVISDKLSKLCSDVIETRTIHSLLGLRLEADMENDTGARILKNHESKGKIQDGLVIVDESSMIGSILKAEIETLPNVQWLFVGDLAQLPPVGETLSELLDSPDVELTQVLRQASDSETLRLATAIRQGDMTLEFTPGRDVHRVDDADELFERALAQFQSDEYKQTATHARMLVFRNDRRRAINQRMRELIVASPEPYVAGEWLVMYQAFSPAKSRLNLLREAAVQAEPYERSRKWKQFYDAKRAAGMSVQQLHVSQEVLVISAGQGTVKVDEWEFPVWNLLVRDEEGQRYTLPILTDEALPEVESIKSQAISAAHTARKQRDEYPKGCEQWLQHEKERTIAWGLYFSLDETFAQVDYAYAMTVHKSQGSTFDHVFVDVPDILSSGGMVKRMLYTACTRPAKSLTFYL